MLTLPTGQCVQEICYSLPSPVPAPCPAPAPGPTTPRSGTPRGRNMGRGILGQMPQEGFHTPRVSSNYVPVMPARLPNGAMLGPPPPYAHPAPALSETPPPTPGASSNSGRQNFGFGHPSGQGYGFGQQVEYPPAHLDGQQQGGYHGGHLVDHLSVQQGGHLPGQQDGHLPGQ